MPGPAWPAALFLAALLVLPVGVLVVYSFWTAQFFTVQPDFVWSNYSRALFEGSFLYLIVRSLVIGLVVAAICVPISYLLAYAITFRLPRWGNRLLLLVMISMLSSYLVRIYAWKTILGPEGAINQFLQYVGFVDAPLAFLLYGDVAIIITLTHILIPYAVLPIYAALQNIDDQVLEASRDLGCSPVRTFIRVTLPLSRPGLVAAFLFCFILAAADYVTPQLVGGSSGMLIGRVISDQFGMAGNPPFGAALSILLMLGYGVVITTLWIALRLVTKIHLPKGGVTDALDRGLSRLIAMPLPWLRSSVVAIMMFLYLPLVIVILFSFNESTAGIFPIKGLTLRWYEEMIASDGFQRSLISSLGVAVTGVIGSLVIATPAAFAVARRHFALKPYLLILAMGPVVVPGVVIGISLLASLSALGMYGGLMPAVGAHILFAIPFVMMAMRARLLEFDWQIEEAARDLGASPTRTLRTITLPIIAPAIVGAAVMVAALSLDEFIITNFVIGANSTLPVYIWGQMRTGITPSVNAIASIILFGSVLLLWISARMLGGSNALGVGISTRTSEETMP